MTLKETIFIDKKPVGVLRQDTFTGQIAFSPISGKSKLPARDWQSVDELKAAVIAAYQNEESPLKNSGPSNPLDGITDHRKPETDV